ncbi:MAG: hypothetical protein E7323_06465 [Clostridiales bacterium]|nr:hypothetical protein [Clostridiales bacterium]
MTTAIFKPARLCGTAPVPPAKSEAHRALLLAALGNSPVTLTGFPPPLCNDTLAMIDGIRGMGATVEQRGETLYIVPAPKAVPGQPMVDCHVHACAAALRMLIPAFLVRGQSVRFWLEPTLFRRPLDAFEPLIAAIGGSMERIPAGENGLCQVIVTGWMKAGSHTIDGSGSSQFASGLLIALAHAMDESCQPAPAHLTVTGPIVSRPYLDMTLSLMQRFAVGYTETSEGEFDLMPRTSGSPATVPVAGDWSQAAVLLCAGAVGQDVQVSGLIADETCTQGDAEIVSVLRRMGMTVEEKDGLFRAVRPAAGLSPITLNCDNIPDIAPIIALTCATIPGVSTLQGVARLRIKECDRLDATCHLLRQMGVVTEVRDEGDTLIVHGGSPIRGGFEADVSADHRMAMLLAVAGSIADAPITVHGVESLNKSWPGFLQSYKALMG